MWKRVAGHICHYSSSRIPRKPTRTKHCTYVVLKLYLVLRPDSEHVFDFWIRHTRVQGCMSHRNTDNAVQCSVRKVKYKYKVSIMLQTFQHSTFHGLCNLKKPTNQYGITKILCDWAPMGGFYVYFTTFGNNVNYKDSSALTRYHDIHKISNLPHNRLLVIGRSQPPSEGRTQRGRLLYPVVNCHCSWENTFLVLSNFHKFRFC